jgi:predicted kinase
MSDGSACDIGLHPGGHGRESLPVPSPRPTLFLTVGLPGSGKTTRAKAIAREHAILRLTPDEWMAPLFGHNDAGGRRDILEGRFVWVAHQLLVGGSSVILDFGCWSPDERYALRDIAGRAGAGFVLVHLAIDEGVRRARCDRRWQQAPGTTFEMTDADHDRYVSEYRPPTEQELGYGPIPDPPAPFESWAHWASDRWPTLPRLDR